MACGKKIAPSRSKAEDWIKQGFVEIFVDGVWKAAGKTSYEMPDDFSTDHVRIQSHDLTELVSRAGAKLSAFLDNKYFNFKDATCLDVGQSTGGFTEVLLQRGAKVVMGIEVGHSQLHERLQGDPRVMTFEHTHVAKLGENARFRESMPRRGFDWIVVDVSFISLTRVLPYLMKLGRKIIFLIKPQFESEKNMLSTDEAISKVKTCFKKCGGIIEYESTSTIEGRDGNQEYFVAGYFS